MLFDLTVEEEMVRRFDYSEANCAVGVIGRVVEGAVQTSGNLMVDEAVEDVSLHLVEKEGPESVPR